MIALACGLPMPSTAVSPLGWALIALVFATVVVNGMVIFYYMMNNMYRVSKRHFYKVNNAAKNTNKILSETSLELIIEGMEMKAEKNASKRQKRLKREENLFLTVVDQAEGKDVDDCLPASVQSDRDPDQSHERGSLGCREAEILTMSAESSRDNSLLRDLQEQQPTKNQLLPLSASNPIRMMPVEFLCEEEKQDMLATMKEFGLTPIEEEKIEASNNDIEPFSNFNVSRTSNKPNQLEQTDDEESGEIGNGSTAASV